MDTAEALKTLEAELRALERRREELHHAIETIRRIVAIGKPQTAESPGAAGVVAQSTATASQNRSLFHPVDGDAHADRAIRFIKAKGGKASMLDIVAEIGDPEKTRDSQYGNIFSALKRRAKSDKRLTKPEPGVWAYKED